MPSSIRPRHEAAVEDEAVRRLDSPEPIPATKIATFMAMRTFVSTAVVRSCAALSTF